jgi:hypothetical protein
MKNEKRAEPVNERPIRRHWGRLLLIAAVCGLAAVIFMCRYQPRDYKPAAPENPQQISPYLTHKLGPDFFNQIQLDEPFVLEVEQTGINDIISRWPWPQPMGEATFSNPVIVFTNKTISLMGTLEFKGISSILTMKGEPFMTPEGQISLNIQSIRLGMLPVTSLVEKLAQKAFEENLSSFEGEPEAEAIIKAIVQNGPFEPVFSISGDKVKISRFSLTTGLLTLTFEPLEKTPPKS